MTDLLKNIFIVYFTVLALLLIFSLICAIKGPRFTDRIIEAEMFEAGFFVETFLPLFMLSAYKNSVHCKSIVILVNNAS